jgi:N,N'-diacetylbacillosaminyl-diphospho-undecaprenol alpha-1,3-N-acetylgalactosaminyltransferase
LIAPDDFSLWIFRKQLIRQLKEQGHEVYTISEPGPYVKALVALGATQLNVSIHRFISPLTDIRLFWTLFFLFKKHRFDIIHTFTVKPNIYGSLAAKAVGVPRIFISLTGLGFLSYKTSDEQSGSALLSYVLLGLYRLAMQACSRAWFQNPDDLRVCLKDKLIAAHKAVLIRSSGVDLEEYSPDRVDGQSLAELRALLGNGASSPLVAMVTRPLKNKGVDEFIAASQILKEKYPLIKFVLAGGVEPHNPHCLTASYLKSKENNNFQWLGWRDDIREFLALADIAVLPSYYPEGVPRNLLEAMAMGKPIVTTDHVGCREVVEPGKNGYLVPVKDEYALAAAIDRLVANEPERLSFGQYSRKIIERDFDEVVVAKRIISEIYQI